MKKYYLIPIIFLFLINLCFSSDLTDLQGNLTNCYSFDEITGNTFYDSTFLVNGTNIGVGINIDGKIEKAYNLTGTITEKLFMGSTHKYIYGSKITFMGWVNFYNLSLQQTIFSNSHDTRKDYFNFYKDTANKLVYIVNSDTNRYKKVTCNNVLLDNTWYLIGFSTDSLIYTGSASGHIKIWINGTECSSYTYTQLDPISSASLLNSNSSFGIFDVNMTPSYSLNGLIDNFMIFNNNMTSSNINFLYNLGKGLTCSMSEPLKDLNATQIIDTTSRYLYQYLGTYNLNITTLNDSGDYVNQGLNLRINNLSINTNFTAGYIQQITFNNESSNFYSINITNIYNNSVYLETNRSTYRLLTNISMGDNIVHYPLHIDYNITMNVTDNSIENITSLINVSVINLNTFSQSYFNLLRTQLESGGLSQGNYIFKEEDVSTCLNFSYNLNEFDSNYNEIIICDTHGFIYLDFYDYLVYSINDLKDWLDIEFNLIFDYFNNLTILVLGVNNSLYTKLDNLNISGGSATLNQSVIDDISLIKKIQICWFKQYEQIEDYYNYCLDYANPFNLTENENNDNLALNLSAYWLNKSLAQEENRVFTGNDCFNLDKYKMLLNKTDYFILNGFLAISSYSIDSAYCWLKLGFKTIASVKV